MYNTESAKQIAYDSSNLCMSDFRYWCETLYKKKTGEYFLHGEGHAMSEYAVTEGGSSRWGEQVIPYSEKQAKKWAENHLDGDEYETIFGKINDEENILRVTISNNQTVAINTAIRLLKHSNSDHAKQAVYHLNSLSEQIRELK